MIKIFTYILAVLILGVSLLISGTVFSFLWLWFVVSLFPLPVLSVLQSMGLVLVVSYVTHQNRTAEPTLKEALRLIRKQFIETPLLYLLLGYSVKTIIGL